MADTTPLVVDDFAAWFAELWGFEPFDWQTDLVAQVHRDRRWPDLVDLPTGTGKTSLIDIAVFLLALDAESDPGERWMPRRIVNVVDRRIVVDQTAERATTIAERLQQGAGGVGTTVARNLRQLAGRDGEGDDDPPLLVATLRGAIARDESWMRRPDIPAVLSSTIDQAGSRLLFRGYGISRGMRPIHAGLLGNDTLWLLDEVHLARPFAQTLAAVGRLRGWRTGATDLPDRWAVVEMTATPADDQRAATTFPETPLDPASHPVIGRRLRASKPADLEVVTVPADGGKADARFAAACAAHARRIVAGEARTVGVIVNRVDTARRIHAELTEAGVTSRLLTGRMRPLDRDRFLERHRARLTTGRARSSVEEPFVLVATQCIEAGADLDLDAIVTEAASLDALTQRFGRVDRDGQLSEAGQQQTSVILARSTDVKEGAVDIVYGEALRRTWMWLNDREPVDFGIRRLVADDDEPPSDLTRAATSAPRLLPTHLDQLSQTSNAISAEPDISRWLHGEAPTSPDVQVVWRADLDEALIRATAQADGEPVRLALSERLNACPPATTEAVSVPIGAARRWLEGRPSPVTDVEGLDIDTTEEGPAPSMRPWVIWRRGEAISHVIATGARPTRRDRLRPGDVIIVPASYGGLTDGTWDPTSTTPVEDLATIALHRTGRADVLRLIPALAPLSPDAEVSWPTADDLDAANPTERRDLVTSLLETIDVDALGLIASEADDVRAVVARLRRSRHRAVLYPLGARWASTGAPPEASLIVWCPAEHTEETSILRGAPADTDAADEGSSFTASRAPLDDHLAGVGRWATTLADHLSLDGDLVADLTLAGTLHDQGKRDRRFQLLLHGGDRLAAAASAATPLAKSTGRQPSPARRQQIRRQSGYPKGARHELTSLALLTPADLDGAHDPDLVTHLVASHHGWCRPFAPPLIDATPVPIDRNGTAVMSDHGLQQIDGPSPARFWRVTERYGWYHLAWLEAVLRLADHRRSEIETDGSPR